MFLAKREKGSGKGISRFLRFSLSLPYFILTGCSVNQLGMLNPQGPVAFLERRLFFNTLALMLIVVLPVIVMSITFVYHYRASHPRRDYKPNWSHSYFLETLWWGIPCFIIVVLAVLTWKKTHELDPYQKIQTSSKPPLLIQAIALPWKWLFIYPEQNIATVNTLVLPQGQEVELWITADNVAMSAFFIPQLSSQIYAMAGMRTQLHVVADHPGDYLGMNTLYNGAGFSDMHFRVHVVPADEMQHWLASTRQSAPPLTDDAYRALLRPSINVAPQMYSRVKNALFQDVLELYMHSLGPAHPRASLFTPPTTIGR